MTERHAWRRDVHHKVAVIGRQKALNGYRVTSTKAVRCLLICGELSCGNPESLARDRAAGNVTHDRLGAIRYVVHVAYHPRWKRVEKSTDVLRGFLKLLPVKK